MHRIVSLIASATEIVCALGFGEELVGRSHECDYPDFVKRLPVCTEPKFNLEGSSYEIDARVKAILQEGLSVYRVDAARLKALQPTLIVTQSQCEVCAVSLRDVEEAVCTWLGSEANIVSLCSNSLSDVWADMRRVAEALGAPEAGTKLVGQLGSRISEISRYIHDSGGCGNRPTVASIEWIDPLMAAGNWMPELIEMTGGINLFGAAGRHSPWMKWEDLCQRDPDIILVSPCGYDIPHSRKDMSLLTEKREWPELCAVRNSRVYLADGNQYFNRPGPRLVESMEILAEILHPGIFNFGHEGTGWQRL